MHEKLREHFCKLSLNTMEKNNISPAACCIIASFLLGYTSFVLQFKTESSFVVVVFCFLFVLLCFAIACQELTVAVMDSLNHKEKAINISMSMLK